MTIILASGSASRRAMLEAAGVGFEIVRPQVDEDAAKDALKAEGIEARGLADALAELKAVAVSRRMPGRIVIGSDSTVALADGTMLDKPDTRERAAEQLRRMRGGTRRLVSAVVGARDGVPVWRHVDVAKLHVRDFSEAFLEAYLDAPVEDLAAIALGRPVARRQIVEIGNLAAVNPLAMIALWGAAANDLAALGDVAVATLTAPLRAMFRRIGIPIAAIAPARGERLGSAASAWGRYYDQDPWVCAGVIANGQAAINCFLERRAGRVAA